MTTAWNVCRIALATLILAPVACTAPNDDRGAGQSITSDDLLAGGDDEGAGAGDGAAGGGCDCSGQADLPYNVDLPLGATFKLTDAFLMKGPPPAAVLSLAMSAPPDWRLAELVADTPYVVVQADCEHEGNHGQGRDRYEITWQNADGSTESDHFTIRYCEEADAGDADLDPPCDCGEGAGGGGASTSAAATTGAGTPGCDVPCGADADCGAAATCFEGCCAAIVE